MGEDGRPNAGTVSPVSPVVPTESAQAAAAIHFGREDLALEPKGAGLNTYRAPLRLVRRSTRGEPVFTERFANVSPTAVHGATCRGYTDTMPTAAADRPRRLTNDEADRCHGPCRDDAEIAAFTARRKRFALLGRADADDLAERLTLRDRDGDDRRLCLECTWLGDTGRCLAAATGRIPGADRRLKPAQTVLQRCEAFGLRKGLT